MENQKEPKDNWKLKEITIRFAKGYKHENSVDRYEGKISFENGEDESFSFRVRPDMAENYIHLMSKDIVTSANALGERLIESLGLAKQNGA